MGSEQSAIALLLFRVGPVLCCAPANPVQTIISPPKLTRPPGTNDASPGIFYHADHVVSVSELRHRFGVAETEREQPGRLIITLQDEKFIAYWVDEIIEVIDTPTEGWSEPSSHLPQGVFSKTLLLNEQIYLFADFAHFANMPDSGYLSQYIDKLASGMSTAEAMTEVIDDKPNEQPTEATTTPEASPSPTTDNIVPTLTATPDTGQNDVQVSDHKDNKEGNKTAIQTDTQQPDSTKELDDSATPPLESTTQDAEKEDEKAIFPEDGKQASPVITTDSAEITAPDSLAQTESDLDVIKNDNVSVSITTETFETKPEPIASEPLEQNTLEPVEAEIEKTTELKAGYLDPVPSTVPESEQGPEKPAFPWQNLAAAVILLITVAGIGIYYSWSSSNKSITRQAKNSQPAIPQKLSMAHTETPAPSPHNDNDEIETDSVLDRESVITTETEIQSTEDEYRAEIKPDNKGVTIILHSPPDESAFKTTRPASTEAPKVQKILSLSADKPKNKNKRGKQEIIHIVVKGDTLWAIAERYVNNPYKYSRLAKLSKIKNPDRIYPGNRVRILRRDNDVK